MVMCNGGHGLYLSDLFKYHKPNELALHVACPHCRLISCLFSRIKTTWRPHSGSIAAF